MAVVLFLLALPLGAWSQSVSSCGAAGDHLKDVKISVSPDPIAKGQSFTIELSGNLDADLSAMNADVDLTIKALDVINQAVKTSVPVSISPGLVAGPQTVSIGPLSLPSLPGHIEADGTIKITNGKKEAVACIKLALNVPAMSDDFPATSAIEVGAAAQDSKLSVCSAASDHMHNLAIASAAGVTTITGSLDEAVTKFVANLDLKLHIGWLSHKIDMAIPVSYSPGFVKGDLKITAGPATSLLSDSKSLIDVSVTGTVKIDDGASQEIACLSIDPASELQPVITV